MKNKILIATKNPHKVEKISDMFKGLSVEIESLLEATIEGDVAEDGTSFEENAIQKSNYFSSKYDGLVVATDGGINIPTLPEWNPLYTKRFAGENITDDDRIKTLLQKMEGKEGDERKMSWQEAISLSRDGKKLFSVCVNGIEGIMAKTYDMEKYKSGIWVCSIWSFPQFGDKNFFDLTEEERASAEISWTMLGRALSEYIKENALLN